MVRSGRRVIARSSPGDLGDRRPPPLDLEAEAGAATVEDHDRGHIAHEVPDLPTDLSGLGDSRVAQHAETLDLALNRVAGLEHILLAQSVGHSGGDDVARPQGHQPRGE